MLATVIMNGVMSVCARCAGAREPVPVRRAGGPEAGSVAAQWAGRGSI